MEEENRQSIETTGTSLGLEMQPWEETLSPYVDSYDWEPLPKPEEENQPSVTRSSNPQTSIFSADLVGVDSSLRESMDNVGYNSSSSESREVAEEERDLLESSDTARVTFDVFLEVISNASSSSAGSSNVDHVKSDQIAAKEVAQGERKPRARRTPWTDEEDELLKQAITAHGNRWSQVALMVSGRTKDQCRERYRSHLDPRLEEIDPSLRPKRFIKSMSAGGALAAASSAGSSTSSPAAAVTISSSSSTSRGEQPVSKRTIPPQYSRVEEQQQQHQHHIQFSSNSDTDFKVSRSRMVPLTCGSSTTQQQQQQQQQQPPSRTASSKRQQQQHPHLSIPHHHRHHRYQQQPPVEALASFPSRHFTDSSRPFYNSTDFDPTIPSVESLFRLPANPLGNLSSSSPILQPVLDTSAAGGGGSGSGSGSPAANIEYVPSFPTVAAVNAAIALEEQQTRHAPRPRHFPSIVHQARPASLPLFHLGQFNSSGSIIPATQLSLSAPPSPHLTRPRSPTLSLQRLQFEQHVVAQQRRLQQELDREKMDQWNTLQQNYQRIISLTSPSSAANSSDQDETSEIQEILGPKDQQQT